MTIILSFARSSELKALFVDYRKGSVKEHPKVHWMRPCFFICPKNQVLNEMMEQSEDFVAVYEKMAIIRFDTRKLVFSHEMYYKEYVKFVNTLTPEDFYLTQEIDPIVLSTNSVNTRLIKISSLFKLDEFPLLKTIAKIKT